MLFSFLKYISPTWYYNISSEESSVNHFFLNYRSLDESQQKLLDISDCYRNYESVLCDAAYQINKKGLFSPKAEPLAVNPQKKRSVTIKLFGGRAMAIHRDVCITDVIDNYCFVKRFFSSSHLVRIFVRRVLTLHNPINEVRGLLKARKVKRINVFAQNGYEGYRKDYEAFESALVKSNPKVSVVIPTLNRYEYMKDVMADLEKQDYKNFEVIVVDQSEPFKEEFYKDWNLDLHVYHQEEKALWLARNNAIKNATGEFIAMSEDDVRVKPDWITQHLKCIDYFKSDISAGVFYPEGSCIPAERSFFALSEQFATGNALFCRDIMRTTGMFDRQFEKQRSGDGEFGMRCYLCGFKSVSNPFADCIDVKAGTGGLRQTGSWDSFHPTKWFAPRPVPSVLYFCRKYHGNHIARTMLLSTIPYSLTSYKYKKVNKMKMVSLLIAVIGFPVVITQVMMSWRQASKKLNEGAKIEQL